jgi:hypothetical protein
VKIKLIAEPVTVQRDCQVRASDNGWNRKKEDLLKVLMEQKGSSLLPPKFTKS